jgi:hypothetical protein
MRAGIVVNVTRADRHRLEAIISDRSAPQKHVWRANIILATADGCGTAEIMRRSGKSKPVVWRWQARFMAEGIEGLTRDKTRKPGKQPLPTATVERVVELTLGPPPGEAPLDRTDARDGGSEPAFGATYLGSPPTRAASHTHVQAVDGPQSSPRSSRMSSASTSILPPMRLFSRSTKRAKSRRSTVPSRACR